MNLCSIARDSGKGPEWHYTVKFPVTTMLRPLTLLRVVAEDYFECAPEFRTRDRGATSENPLPEEEVAALLGRPVHAARAVGARRSWERVVSIASHPMFDASLVELPSSPEQREPEAAPHRALGA